MREEIDLLYDEVIRREIRNHLISVSHDLQKKIFTVNFRKNKTTKPEYTITLSDDKTYKKSDIKKLIDKHEPEIEKVMK